MLRAHLRTVRQCVPCDDFTDLILWISSLLCKVYFTDFHIIIVIGYFTYIVISTRDTHQEQSEYICI